MYKTDMTTVSLFIFNYVNNFQPKSKLSETVKTKFNLYISIDECQEIYFAESTLSRLADKMLKQGVLK